jgi:uncharacterized membrane protein
MSGKQWALAIGVTSVAFMALDFTWIALAGPALYQPALAPFLATHFNGVAGLGFYALYLPAVVILAVRPALHRHSMGVAVLHGAILGLAAYGTYDLTNLAMLRDWPATISLIDLAWGTTATILAALAGYRAAR